FVGYRFQFFDVVNEASPAFSQSHYVAVNLAVAEVLIAQVLVIEMMVMAVVVNISEIQGRKYEM
ncbi:MAG: hypothetical protein ACPGSN_08715, partial [Psychrobium sp.]